MNTLKFIILSFLTIFFLFGCTSDSNLYGENTTKAQHSELPAAEGDERETIWDVFNREDPSGAYGYDEFDENSTLIGTLVDFKNHWHITG